MFSWSSLNFLELAIFRFLYELCLLLKVSKSEFSIKKLNNITKSSNIVSDPMLCSCRQNLDFLGLSSNRTFYTEESSSICGSEDSIFPAGDVSSSRLLAVSLEFSTPTGFFEVYEFSLWFFFFLNDDFPFLLTSCCKCRRVLLVYESLIFTGFGKYFFSIPSKSIVIMISLLLFIVCFKASSCCTVFLTIAPNP